MSRRENDNRREAAEPWRKWYRTARWQELRMAVFARDTYTCAMCECLEGDASKLVADHKVAHKGDAVLFWDARNIQTLCASPCHNRFKQREERGRRIVPIGLDGWPIEEPSNEP